MAHGFSLSRTQEGPLPADADAFLALLARLRAGGAADEEERAAAALFDWSRPITVARAPGRLDVMGGIADYSGSLVLQMPISEAAFAAAQLGPGDGALSCVSLGAAGRSCAHSVPAAALLDAAGAPLPYAEARARLAGDAATSWAAYPLGTLHVLAREAGAEWSRGVRLLLASAVPEGKGVSSSAAVEVAAMSAAAPLAGLALEGRQLALWCQRAENAVVGAPCGVMDQMASALGAQGRLLALLCRPAEVQPPATLPPHLALWGIDSGLRHSVGGSDYGAVRAGAFMGRAIARQRAAAAGLPQPACLCELPVNAFERDVAPHLPDTITGAAFAAAHGDHEDVVTPLRASQTYAVRVPAAHAVHEHARVSLFRALLGAAPGSEQLRLLGQLMLQSHTSYSACGLGSPGTDALVALVEELGPARGLFGAKITGGGSGGTVCVLGAAGPEGEAAVAEVVARYAAAHGVTPHVFRGSSPGAVEFGTLTLEPSEF